MKHPQTIALRIKPEYIDNIAKYGCCAFVTLWSLGLECDDGEAIRILSDAIKAGVILDDCTVKWKEFIFWLSGRKPEVEFRKINRIDDIIERTPVRFDYNGYSHWVGVENGQIAYNPLEHSVCVQYGVPTEARILKLW